MKNILFLFLGIFCSISEAQIPSDGLVAHFPFNGNANDESGSGYNGEVYGATLTTDRFGNANSAYSFDGVDDFIWASFISVLNGAGESTFSCWYQTDLGFSIGSGTLLGHWKNDGQYNGPIGEQISIFNDGSFNFSLIGGQGVASGLNLAPTSNWHKVDFVYNGSLPIDSRIALYCDGQFAQYLIMANAPTHIGVQATRTYLGASCGPDGADDAWSHYRGKMDDVLLYNRALTSAEISELYQNQSTNIPSLTCSITSSSNVLCSGESSQLTVSTNQVNLNNAWTQLGNLDVPIHAGAGTIYNGKIIVAAGGDQVSNQLLVRTFDLSSLQSATINALIPHAVGEPGFGFFNENLYVIGGYNGGTTNYNQSFNVNTLSWSLNATMPTSRSILSSAQIGNNIYVLGGFPQVQTALERYNALTNTWEILPNVPTSRLTVNTSAAINGKIYYFSGRNAWMTSYFNKNEMYDPATNVWTEKAPTPFANYGASACAYNGRIYVLGGSTGTYQEALDGTQTLSNQLWIYNPETDSWVEGASFPKYIHLAQLLSDGNDLYCVGGICSETPTGIKYTSSAVYKLGVEYSGSYSWSTSENTSSINVSPAESTTFTCTVTQGSQTCTDSITITVNPLLDWYTDADGDGFGNESVVVQDCNQPVGYVADNTDCNDVDASTYPSTEETCFNQIDDNCNGQVDENCAIFGCINPNACNFNPEANTDDNSCILSQPEICDGLDNNCNNQIDEDLSPASINAVAATTALYPVCSGNSIKSANLNNGANSAVIDGSGNDLWYSFTAQYNTFRAGLSAATGDNDVRIYSMSNGGCLELIETEHETTSGNQTLLTDQLTVGQTYYVAVHNISGPMNASAKICFNHLNASSCDHYYSNNTGIYTSVCNSFKAQYRANAVAYTFEILSAIQNGLNQNITPWSYTTPTSNTVVARLGTLLPANQGMSPIVYTMRVPVLYSLFDAAGNFENLYAQATATCTATLNAESTIALRSSDRCPTNKSITSTIAPDRTVCGAMRYDWEFTEVLPNLGTAQVVQGGAYASAFFLSNIPGVATGKTYNVRVRPVHSSGNAGSWGAVQCLRIGNAGMILQSDSENEIGVNLESRVSAVSIYPNPTATGSFVLQYNGSRRGESIFAQEPTTTESTFAQELIMLDITGKVVFRQQVVLNGNSVEVQFGDLAGGLYFVSIGKYRMRLEVMP